MAFGSGVFYGGGALYAHTSVNHLAEASVTADSHAEACGGLVVLAAAVVDAQTNASGAAAVIRKGLAAVSAQVEVTANGDREGGVSASVEIVAVAVVGGWVTRQASSLATGEVTVGLARGGLVPEAQAAATGLSEASASPSLVVGASATVTAEVIIQAVGDNSRAESTVFVGVEIRAVPRIERLTRAEATVTTHASADGYVVKGAFAQATAEATVTAFGQADFGVSASITAQATTTASGAATYVASASVTATGTVVASTSPPTVIRAIGGTFIAVTSPGAASVSERKPFSWPRKIVA